MFFSFEATQRFKYKPLNFRRTKDLKNIKKLIFTDWLFYARYFAEYFIRLISFTVHIQSSEECIVISIYLKNSLYR